jgi:dihydrofolate synthase/folylpolyglutamate synthase
MKDFAVSEDPAVQAQLDRLGALTLPQGRFGLETIRALLARLGDPQRRLPPTFHVAGTNGKGSTCAYLRAMLEAAGLSVHVATKPHLVRYNERIRIAGRLVADEELAALLAEVLDAGADLQPSFFEVTAAAAFLAFARHRADACVIEVGLGGRLDATNVLEAPLACGVASLGIDHEAFLLRPEDGTPMAPLARIAFEKASIAKPGAPLVTQAYPAEAEAEILRMAEQTGARLAMRGRDWWAEGNRGIAYRDGWGELTLPLPTIPGSHQADNAALAVALLRHQHQLTVPPAAMAGGIVAARWPGRLQRLGMGPLTALVPGREVWIDGAHNADAARALAAAMPGGFDLIFALMRNRPVEQVLGPLVPLAASATFLPLPGHDCHDPVELATQAPGIAERRVADGLEAALTGMTPAPRPVLIAGSLYQAGEALRLNRELPD